jgi:hypothetical protein
MKRISLCLASGLLLMGVADVTRAATVSGFIQCDANQNGRFDDIGIPGVRVVVVNLSHSFSNATITAADGSYSLMIPDFDPDASNALSQIYGTTLNFSTLPAAATIIFPLPITNVPTHYVNFAADHTSLIYVSGSGIHSEGNWLVGSPDCGISDNAQLAGGAMLTERRKPAHVFGGNVTSGDSPGGTWVNVVSGVNVFRTTAIEAAQCSAVIPAAPAKPYRQMDFMGTGTLKGTGKRASSNDVFFIARVIDSGQLRKPIDRYYLHVFDSNGVTRVLISGDAANPANMITVPISNGSLRIREP